MPKVYEPYIPYLWQAMSAKYGIKILTSNVKLSQAHLYAARKSLNDPDLDRLQIRPNPRNLTGGIWIIKGAEKEQNNG